MVRSFLNNLFCRDRLTNTPHSAALSLIKGHSSSVISPCLHCQCKPILIHPDYQKEIFFLKQNKVVASLTEDSAKMFILPLRQTTQKEG